MSTFTLCTASINTIQSLSDNPNVDDGLSSAQLKAKFDLSAYEIKDYINNSLIPQFDSTSQTYSGAKKIGIFSIAGLTALNIQDALEQIVSIGLGGLPGDGTITDAKMASDNKIGSLAGLTTSYKTNIVGAINEVYSTFTASIVNLAGAGRTTETVKGAYTLANTASSDLSTHIADTTKHINILTTRGDILRRGAVTTERYALGSSGKVLQSNGTDAVWDWPLYDYLGGTVGSGSTNYFNFSGISTLYKGLRLVLKIKTDYSTDPYDTLSLRINDNTDAQYFTQLLTNSGASISAYKNTTGTSFILGNINCSHANSVADSYCNIIVDFDMPNDTDNLKCIKWLGSSLYASTSMYSFDGKGTHRTLKDYITSIRVLTVGNMDSKSKAYIYGIK